MPDDRTDSDFLSLTQEVEKSRLQNTEEHGAIMRSVQENRMDIDKLTMIQADMSEMVKRLGNTIYGNGKAGLAEDVRAQKAFSATLTRLLWVAATVGTAAAVTGIISLAKHVIAP